MERKSDYSIDLESRNRETDNLKNDLNAIEAKMAEEKLHAMSERSDPDEEVERLFLRLLNGLRTRKPNDRSEKDRRYAVTLTETEKAFAYFDAWVLTGGDHRDHEYFG